MVDRVQGSAPLTPAAKPQAQQAAPVPVAKSGPLPADAGPAAIWSGLVHGRAMRWTKDDIRVGAGGLEGPFSWTEALGKRAVVREELDPGITVSLTARPKSAVGQLVSVQATDSYMTPGAAHPGGETGFRTVDLEHPDRPARLDAYFPPDAIRQALLADPLVKKALAQNDVKTPAPTLEGLVKQLSGAYGKSGSHDYCFPADLMEQFAFHHVDGNQVAVRLALPAGSDADRDAVTQLGIMLPIPAAMAQDFAGGTYMRDFDKLAGQPAMQSRFTTPKH